MRTFYAAALIALLSLCAFGQQPEQQFTPNPHLYDTSANATAEIANVIAEAHKDHRRIILVFGGNWCIDCQVLDYRFHQEPIRPLVDNNFHVVHVDIGEFDKNLDLVAKYGTTLKKGVPTLSVLDSNGKLLYGMMGGEFESAASMNPQAFIDFLNKWKPAAR